MYVLCITRVVETINASRSKHRRHMHHRTCLRDSIESVF
jgi:hypothetical protein